MAWTTPVDQSTGFLVTAAVYNAHIIDNLKYLHGDAGSTIDLTAGTQFLKPYSIAMDATGLIQVGGDTQLSRADVGVFKTANVKRASRAIVTYSASITIDPRLGEWQFIQVTNGTAFTINAPSPSPGANETQDLSIEIFNNSGGAMGAITWNAIFKPLSAGQPVNYSNPASTKTRSVHCRWSGGSWIVMNASSVDY